MDQSLFIHHLLKWLLPGFSSYESSCYKHSCAGFCVDVNFQLLWVNTYRGASLLDHKSLFLSIPEDPKVLF